METFNLPNIPLLYDTLPNELYDSLLRESYQNLDKKESSYNDQLVGHIKKEYYLKENVRVMKPYINFLANKLASSMERSHLSPYEGNKFVLESLLVNFQKKHEFNPVHIHKGAFSFVIIMKIPYELHEEEEIFDANSDHSSRLGFVYSNTLGKICYYNMNICKSDEKKIIMFPAGLNHVVYPFYTSDDYRITISGNVHGK